MELSDGVHSRDAFQHNGADQPCHGEKTVGKWRIQRDELCLAPAKAEETCYAVWAAGKKIELRLKGRSSGDGRRTFPTAAGEVIRTCFDVS